MRTRRRAKRAAFSISAPNISESSSALPGTVRSPCISTAKASLPPASVCSDHAHHPLGHHARGHELRRDALRARQRPWRAPIPLRSPPRRRDGAVQPVGDGAVASARNWRLSAASTDSGVFKAMRQIGGAPPRPRQILFARFRQFVDGLRQRFDFGGCSLTARRSDGLRPQGAQGIAQMRQRFQAQLHLHRRAPASTSHSAPRKRNSSYPNSARARAHRRLVLGELDQDFVPAARFSGGAPAAASRVQRDRARCGCASYARRLHCGRSGNSWSHRNASAIRPCWLDTCQ